MVDSRGGGVHLLRGESSSRGPRVSRRLPTSPLVGILILMFIATALSPFLSTHAAGFGEPPYESNQVVTGTNFNVYTWQSVAQSFVATEMYRLLNLTLRLRNTGDTTRGLNATIPADAPCV